MDKSLGVLKMEINRLMRALHVLRAEMDMAEANEPHVYVVLAVEVGDTARQVAALMRLEASLEAVSRD